MVWVNASERLPKPFACVWIKTSTGRQATAYVKSNGEWIINCPKVAADNPTVMEWRE